MHPTHTTHSIDRLFSHLRLSQLDYDIRISSLFYSMDPTSITLYHHSYTSASHSSIHDRHHITMAKSTMASHSTPWHHTIQPLLFFFTVYAKSHNYRLFKHQFHLHMIPVSSPRYRLHPIRHFFSIAHPANQ